MSPNAKSYREIIGITPSSTSIRDSTLIIIDAQNEYASGALQVDDVARSRCVIADLLARYRRAGKGQNIVHVMHEVPPSAPVFTPGTALAQEFDELMPAVGEKVVTKHFPNAFAQMDLQEYLGGLGEVGKKLVLVGYMAHICVSTTTRAASELGYDVFVARDGVGARSIPGVEAETLRRFVLSELADAFATVIDGGDVRG